MALDLFGAAISSIIFFFLVVGNNGKAALNRRFAAVVLCTIAILVLDAISWSFDGISGPHSAFLTRCVSFGGYVLMYLVIGAFTRYLSAYIETRAVVSTPLIRFALGLCAFSVLTVMLSQFGGLYYTIDERNLYHRGDLYWLSQALLFLGLLMNAAIVFVYRHTLSRKECVSFLSYLALPAVLNVLHICIYDLSWSCVALALAVVIIYAGIQSDQAGRLAAQELELSESRTAIMLSQIQPHFLFNVLNTIGDMCDTDPVLAQETVFEFADYLRANMDSLSSPHLVPFQSELNHVKTYLALEVKRFGDRLRVEFDIRTEDFCLPPLTIQPIVENAVQHGLTVRPRLGTVLIRTEESADGVRVTIADDGVGFDPSVPPSDEKRHLGIDNVRKRLAAICGGTLIVESALGQGTAVVLTIPRKERRR